MTRTIYTQAIQAMCAAIVVGCAAEGDLPESANGNSQEALPGADGDGQTSSNDGAGGGDNGDNGAPGQDDDDSEEASAESECGNEGLDMLWRFTHRQPLDEQPPAPAADWQRYSDPYYPTINFLYPPDWTATSLSTSRSSGVQIQSPTGEARMVFYQVFLPEGVENPEDMFGAGLSQLLEVESSGAPSCSETGEADGALSGGYLIQGLPADSDSSVLAVAETYVDNGTLGIGIGAVVSAVFNAVRAPTDEFTTTTQNVFLPILFQLLIGNPDSYLADTDGDGTSNISDTDDDNDGRPDAEDSAPEDPNN